jgi:hypothetical protein
MVSAVIPANPRVADDLFGLIRDFFLEDSYSDCLNDETVGTNGFLNLFCSLRMGFDKPQPFINAA